MSKDRKYTSRKVSVAVSRTISLGNYESIKIHASLSADISDLDDDLDLAYEELFDECTKQLLIYQQQVVDK
jgi:hypothetical protein